jgi:CSLREA domain-containing protein
MGKTTTFCKRTIYAVVVFLFVFTGGAKNASGVVFTVDTAADTGGDCSVPGSCTLRAAITEANATDELDTINFSITGTILLSSPLPTIVKSLKINGPGMTTLTIDDDGNASSVLEIDNISGLASMNVAVAGLTLTGGDADFGGGIEIDDADVTITETKITGNRASWGGGIFIWPGTLTLIRTTIENNLAHDEGGGIYLRGSLVEIDQSTIKQNQAPRGGAVYNLGCTVVFRDCAILDNSYRYDDPGGDAGGIYNVSGDVTLTNCTLSGNIGWQHGAILSEGVPGLPSIVKIFNCTIAQNQSKDYLGTGIHTNGYSTIYLNNTILDLDDACSGIVQNVVSRGHNLGGVTCNLIAAGDIVGVDPNLEVVAQDNGGPTRTIKLLYGSPAIDAGDDSFCPATDQRGVSRPQDGDGDFIARCDIGAYELKSSPVAYLDSAGGG